MSGTKDKVLRFISTVKSGEPVLNLDRSVSAETLWPSTLDKEADKAAAILRSFFLDGFVVPYRTIGICPQEVVKQCWGLAVFHVLRDDICSSNASGSGVLTTRGSDGNWYTSGILVDSGPKIPSDVDAIDVVLVINNETAFNALSGPKSLLDDRFPIAPGPKPQSEAAGTSKYSTKPSGVSIWSYAKSKGNLMEVDFAGSIIREATAKNERFFGISPISSQEILTGKVKAPSSNSDYLSSTLQVLWAQSSDYGRLPKAGGCPGDCRIKAPSKTGGL